MAWEGPAFTRTVITGHPFVVSLLPVLALLVVAVFAAAGGRIGRQVVQVIGLIAGVLDGDWVSASTRWVIASARARIRAVD